MPQFQPPLSTMSCSILARYSSVCCPIPTQPGHSTERPYLSKMFCRKILFCCRVSRGMFRGGSSESTTPLMKFKHSGMRLSPVATHPLIGLLVPAACSFLSHSTEYHHTGSRSASPKHCCLPDASNYVFSLLLLESTAGIHRCGQACRRKLLASTSSSTWLHPLSDFAPSTLLQMAQLLQCSPCPE